MELKWRNRLSYNACDAILIILSYQLTRGRSVKAQYYHLNLGSESPPVGLTALWIIRDEGKSI